MPWHPPIPAGKLYSEDALRLGPGIALLLWCYDRIQRDATIEVQLERAATDIGKPYGTIRDWWRLLRDGPFFCEQIDRGKRGWIVQMAGDWLDWHVMTNNYPDAVNAEMSALTERRDVSGEEVESSVKAPSKRRHRRDVSDEEPAYKEDHRSGDQETENARAKSLFTAVAEVCQIDLKLCTQQQRSQIAQTAKALTKAGKTPEDIPKVIAWWYRHDWRGKKGDAPRPAQLREVWQQATTYTEYTNGKHIRQSAGQHPERAQFTTDATDILGSPDRHDRDL